MTYRDVLIQLLSELTDESKETGESFIAWWNKRSPNEKLAQELSPEEADILLEALRAGAGAPMVKLFRDNLESFRLARREK